MILSISTDLNEAKRINEGNFIELGILERPHIEEWVRTNPEMLGEDLLIVSVEFDRFSNSNDRLDVLALDRSGNLVVIELKRVSAAGYADLQAIRYAAMVSSMTIELLIPHYITYRKKYYDETLSDKEARNQLVDFVEADSLDESDPFTEISNKPRIILCAEGFSKEITATVLWLRESNIDISCVKITPYKIDNQIVIVPKVVIPLEEAKQYLIELQHKEEVKKQAERNVRPKTMKILIENNLIQEGDKIFLKKNLPDYLEYEKENSLFHAKITGKLGQSNAVIWDKDGKEYSISALTQKIFKDIYSNRQHSGRINGSIFWVNNEGKSLWEMAEEFLATKGE